MKALTLAVSLLALLVACVAAAIAVKVAEQSERHGNRLDVLSEMDGRHLRWFHEDAILVVGLNGQSQIGGSPVFLAEDAHRVDAGGLWVTGRLINGSTLDVIDPELEFGDVSGKKLARVKVSGTVKPGRSAPWETFIPALREETNPTLYVSMPRVWYGHGDR